MSGSIASIVIRLPLIMCEKHGCGERFANVRNRGEFFRAPNRVPVDLPELFPPRLD